LAFGLGFGVVFALLFGFDAVLFHFAFRLWLRVNDKGPLRWGRFLNWATPHLLLRRNGPSYQWIHLELRDFLARRSGESDLLVPQLPSQPRGATTGLVDSGAGPRIRTGATMVLALALLANVAILGDGQWRPTNGVVSLTSLAIVGGLVAITGLWTMTKLRRHKSPLIVATVIAVVSVIPGAAGELKYAPPVAFGSMPRDLRAFPAPIDWKDDSESRSVSPRNIERVWNTSSTSSTACAKAESAFDQWVDPASASELQVPGPQGTDCAITGHKGVYQAELYVRSFTAGPSVFLQLTARS
jgi:hypothetical protein